MKKSTISVGLLTIILSSGAGAGTMGPVQTSAVKPFIGLEGGYTWTKLDGFDINIIDSLRINSSEDKKGWSGRVSTGLIHPLSDMWAISGELGWGYYGKATFTPVLSDSSDLNFKTSQDGFDVLAGIMYTQPSYDLFLKAGAMVQNSRLQVSSNLPSTAVGVNGNLLIKTNQTEALPEIKLGGAYHLTQQLSLTGAWTHAFGSTQKVNYARNPANFQTNVDFNLQNPSMDNLMVGLQYRFG